MPWVPEEIRNRELQEKVDMAGELEVWRRMGGVLHLAGFLQQEIIERLERLDLTPSQIAEEAFQAVVENGVYDARKKLAEEYEEAHRSELYQRVMDTVETTEGQSILQEVKDKIASDPELAIELHESARRELQARAMETVKQEITAEQQAIFESETVRQIALDKLDVEFALEGELDLHRDDINEMLEPEDTLMLTYTGVDNKKGRIVLRWIKDAKGQLGWVFESCSEQLYRSDGYEANFATDKFLGIGSTMHDMVEGDEVLVPNLLKKNAVLAMFREDKKGKPKVINAQHVTRSGHSYSYSYKSVPLKLQKIDFRTRTLDFNEK